MGSSHPESFNFSGSSFFYTRQSTSVQLSNQIQGHEYLDVRISNRFDRDRNAVYTRHVRVS